MPGQCCITLCLSALQDLCLLMFCLLCLLVSSFKPMPPLHIGQAWPAASRVATATHRWQHVCWCGLLLS